MEEKARRIAELLALMANEHRLLILCALQQGPRTVGQIHEHCPGITASALSQHLSRLRAAGVLDSEKQGMHVVYSLSDARVAALMDAIRRHCCEDA